MTKPLLKKIDGILLLDKPLDISSNGILQRVKRLFGAKKAGHTGSLDPLATGMLPLCFGEATKISQYLLESDKYYRVTGKLGIRTTTGDAEGEVMSTAPVNDITYERLEPVLRKFMGRIEQIPPMFSALKFQGQPLYKLARQGIEIERKPREVHIHSLHLDEFIEGDSFVLDVHCTKGTYIRTLVDDIGELLGCGAHVSNLRRTAVAPYESGKMYTLEALEEINRLHGQDALQGCLLPLESSVQGMPAIVLTSATAFYIRTGQAVRVPESPLEGLVRLFHGDRFIGIGEIIEDGRVTPRRLFQ